MGNKGAKEYTKSNYDDLDEAYAHEKTFVNE
jgi:hypothetical protein